MSCSSTHASFRLFHVDLKPEAVTGRLGVRPTATHGIGDRISGGVRARMGGWFLSTEGQPSLDVGDHLDVLLHLLEPAAEALAELRDEGYHEDVFCYWAAENGQGGPALRPPQMAGLAALGLPIHFDVYSC